MSDRFGEDDDVAEESSWPAFVDLFSATSLLFITFAAIFVYVLTVQRGENSDFRRELETRLKAESQNGSLFKVDSADGQFITIRISDSATFPQGQFTMSSLKPQGTRALLAIGGVLRDSQLRALYSQVNVLGNTDRTPYERGGRSNWELSASRAAAVARFLVTEAEVDPCILSAAGRGPYYPVTFEPPDSEPRDTAVMEGNRRIEIQIVPQRRQAVKTVTCDPRGDRPGKISAPAVVRAVPVPTDTADSAATQRP